MNLKFYIYDLILYKEKDLPACEQSTHTYTHDLNAYKVKQMLQCAVFQLINI